MITKNQQFPRSTSDVLIHFSRLLFLFDRYFPNITIQFPKSPLEHLGCWMKMAAQLERSLAPFLRFDFDQFQKRHHLDIFNLFFLWKPARLRFWFQRGCRSRLSICQSRPKYWDGNAVSCAWQLCIVNYFLFFEVRQRPQPDVIMYVLQSLDQVLPFFILIFSGGRSKIALWGSGRWEEN